MKKLLWIGDAIAATGFSKVTHNVLDRLKGWEIFVLGLNYYGEPHEKPYRIFPCIDPFRMANHPFGIDRLPELVQHYAPDLIVVQNDPWNIKGYTQLRGDVRMVGVLPVDGRNVRGTELNPLAHSIFWTEFGRQEAHEGGYVGSSSVIPLGVDLSIFKPLGSKSDIRKDIGLPERLHDAFIVGNVNRNQPRKRLDLTISFFCQWVKDYTVDDAYLYLHAAPTGEHEYELSQLMEYYGLSNRLVTYIPNVGYGIPEDRMPLVYNAFDLQITTTQGEGWGLTTLEGMACGTPQIVPDWSALGEWVYDGAQVPCSEIACTLNRINIVGGIPSRADFLERMTSVYTHEEVRDQMTNDGIKTAIQPQHRWDKIAAEYAETFESVFKEPTVLK